MRGLYISFIIKRRTKLSKILDYFAALAVGILAFIFVFYVEFIGRKNKYTTSYKNLQALNAELEEQKKIAESKSTGNASALEKSYNQAYNELAAKTDSVKDYTKYIKDIYAAELPGVYISGFEIIPQDKNKDGEESGKIILNLTFDRSDDSQVDYRYRNALLDYDWIPKNGVVYTDTNLTTTWEVYINGTTVEE